MSLFDSGFNTLVSIQHRKAIDLGRNNSRQNKEVGQALANFIAGAAGSGTADALTVVANQTGQSAKAGATLVFATASGTIGATLNGVLVSAANQASDTLDAQFVAAAINASVDPLVLGWMRATNVFGQVTLASVTAGEYLYIRDGNSEYRFRATAAATGRLGEFSISGNDTADALALANAINSYPVCNQQFRAESVAAVLYIYPMDGSTTGRLIGKSGGGTMTIVAMAAGARCHIEAIVPTAMGNAITIAASGTNVSVANTNTRLVGGLGGMGASTGTIKRANLVGVR